jgi:hypothetical protein
MQAPSPQPTLAISKSQLYLDNLTLGEYVPIERVTALMKSNLMGNVWDENNYYAHRYSQLHHSNQTQQLQEYLKLYSNRNKVFRVQYNRGKDGYGRAITKKALGLTAFAKNVRNSLIKDLYYDFDLSNAQPAIIKNLCENNTDFVIPCPCITDYINRREDILKEITDYYGVTRSKAKKLMLRLCFFGSVEQWKKDNNIVTLDDLQFPQMFRNELNQIANTIKSRNKSSIV